MKVTSTQASKIVKELIEKIENEKALDRKSRTFLAAMGEDPETLRPKYDFIETTKKITDMELKLRKIKHAINVFNVNQKLEGSDMTIDQALIALPQLTKEKIRLTEMASRLPKERKDSYLNKNIIDYEYVNYDIDLVKKTLEYETKYLSKLQTELNRINSSVEFEIPD